MVAVLLDLDKMKMGQRSDWQPPRPPPQQRSQKKPKNNRVLFHPDDDLKNVQSKPFHPVINGPCPQGPPKFQFNDHDPKRNPSMKMEPSPQVNNGLEDSWSLITVLEAHQESARVSTPKPTPCQAQGQSQDQVPPSIQWKSPFERSSSKPRPIRPDSPNSSSSQPDGDDSTDLLFDNMSSVGSSMSWAEDAVETELTQKLASLWEDIEAVCSGSERPPGMSTQVYEECLQWREAFPKEAQLPTRSRFKSFSSASDPPGLVDGENRAQGQGEPQGAEDEEDSTTPTPTNPVPQFLFPVVAPNDPSPKPLFKAKALDPDDDDLELPTSHEEDCPTPNPTKSDKYVRLWLDQCSTSSENNNETELSGPVLCSNSNSRGDPDLDPEPKFRNEGDGDMERPSVKSHHPKPLSPILREPLRFQRPISSRNRANLMTPLRRNGGGTSMTLTSSKPWADPQVNDSSLPPILTSSSTTTLPSVKSVQLLPSIRAGSGLTISSRPNRSATLQQPRPQSRLSSQRGFVVRSPYWSRHANSNGEGSFEEAEESGGGGHGDNESMTSIQMPTIAEGSSGAHHQAQGILPPLLRPNYLPLLSHHTNANRKDSARGFQCGDEGRGQCQGQGYHSERPRVIGSGTSNRRKPFLSWFFDKVSP